MKGIKLLAVSAACFGISCDVTELDSQAYLAWVTNSENGLHQIKSIGQIQLDVQYTPSTYLDLKKGNTSDAEMQQYTLKMSVLDSLNYDISKYNILSISEYEARMQYMSFAMQQDIKLIDGADTLNCKWFHFERGADIKPQRVWLLGFDKLNTTDSQTKVLIIDASTFGAGIVKFKFDKDILIKIPTLKTS